MRILKENCQLSKDIEEIEELMKEKGIEIITFNEMFLSYKGNIFKIGYDSTVFPRTMDEPIIVRE